MKTYQIFVDGLGYAGESDFVEDAQPGMANGWTHDRARTVSGIAFGNPIDICGVRNLTSHLDRIIRRIGEANEVVIRRVPENSKVNLATAWNAAARLK